MSKNFGDYLASVGSFLLDATRETVWRHEDESIQEERAAGMATTIAALYEAKVKDEEIIRLVQKYYGVTESDAQEQLRIEKTIEHPDIRSGSADHLRKLHDAQSLRFPVLLYVFADSRHARPLPSSLAVSAIIVQIRIERSQRKAAHSYCSWKLRSDYTLFLRCS